MAGRLTTSAAKRQASVITALESLTEGLYGMFSKRLELFRIELLEDVQRMGVWAVTLVICAVVIALGYGLLNLAVVLLVGAFSTASWAPGATAAGLGLVNVVAAIAVGINGGKRLAAARVKMNVTVDEFRRDQKWLSEIREPSPEPVETPANS